MASAIVQRISFNTFSPRNFDLLRSMQRSVVDLSFRRPIWRQQEPQEASLTSESELVLMYAQIGRASPAYTFDLLSQHLIGQKRNLMQLSVTGTLLAFVIRVRSDLLAVQAELYPMLNWKEWLSWHKSQVMCWRMMLKEKIRLCLQRSPNSVRLSLCLTKIRLSNYHTPSWISRSLCAMHRFVSV